ncbi:antitoxin VbhA family protein [Pseudokineococcus sp. 1T1Z-3]|uniref:antitoxin VbhA family protein n=1 Tax=Pseudokineococcus sp. 1T1Z-3 TaxID=3132745 RepID=UPI0030B60EAC
MWTQRFPEHFARLDDEGRFALTQTLADGYLEGWEPTSQEVANLVDVELGVIDRAEYMRRTLSAGPDAAAAG